jgi:hypothetical protein
MTPNLSEFIDAAAAEAKKKSGKVRVANAHLAAAAGVAAGGEATFCQFWPVVKEGLELLKSIVPAWAKWLIDAVVALGDKICA